MHNDLHALRRILKSCHTLAVVGLSAEWHRPSYFAAKYMQSHGFKIVPVNPRYAGGQVLGETCYASLSDIPFKVDMVDVFRRAEELPAVLQEILALHPLPKYLWLQQGLRDEQVARTARDAGLTVVMDRCLKVDYARLIGQ